MRVKVRPKKSFFRRLNLPFRWKDIVVSDLGERVEINYRQTCNAVDDKY